MHLGSAEDDAAAGAGRYGGLRDALRAAGVRTATDLVAASRPGPERARQNCGCADPVRGSSDLDSVVRIVAADLDRSEADVRHRLEVLCATLDRSEWIGRIENWRNSELIESKLCRRQHVGSSGDLRAGDPRVGPPSCRRLAGHEMSDRGPAA